MKRQFLIYLTYHTIEYNMTRFKLRQNYNSNLKIRLILITSCAYTDVLCLEQNKYLKYSIKGMSLEIY